MSIPLNCTGWLQPDHEHAVQAMTALKQQRYSDALNHIKEIPETPILQRAWKKFLHGRVHLAQSQLGDAESSLLQSAAMAFIEGMGTDQMSQSRELRLCACALHHAGTPITALRIHRWHPARSIGRADCRGWYVRPRPSAGLAEQGNFGCRGRAAD